MSYFEDYVEDGLCCESCGEFLGGGEPGFVRRCAGCEPPRVVNRGRKQELDGESALPRHNRYSIPPSAGTVDCPYCAAHPKLNGLADHIKAKHPEKIEGANP
jgi:hypothetical protein